MTIGGALCESESSRWWREGGFDRLVSVRSRPLNLNREKPSNSMLLDHESRKRYYSASDTGGREKKNGNGKAKMPSSARVDNNRPWYQQQNNPVYQLFSGAFKQGPVVMHRGGSGRTQ